MIAELFIVFILILLNGVFSMSEIAVVSSRRTRLEMMARKSLSAQKALELHNSPNKFLSTVQIGITLIGILTGIFSGASMTEALSFQLSQIQAIEPYAHSTAVVIVVVGITFFSLVFGELIPKRIGMSKPELIAGAVAVPMSLLSKATAPFIWLLTLTSDFFIKLLGIKTDESKLTEEEIKAIVEQGANTGVIEEIEQEIVERVFYLGDKKVSGLMTHRSDLVWLDSQDDFEKNMQIVLDTNYSVYPYCDGDLDNVIGMLAIKDILKRHLKGELPDLKILTKTVNYFPENMSAYDCLEKFKESKVHHGLVVDEYGNVQGMVTINDLFHALVGDISQEEAIGYELLVREDGSWLVDGQYPLDDFINELEIEIEDTELQGINTVGGMAIHFLKDLPKAGEKYSWKHLEFEIMDMDEKRVDKILVTAKK